MQQRKTTYSVKYPSHRHQKTVAGKREWYKAEGKNLTLPIQLDVQTPPSTRLKSKRAIWLDQNLLQPIDVKAR